MVKDLTQAMKKWWPRLIIVFFAVFGLAVILEDMFSNESIPPIHKISDPKIIESAYLNSTKDNKDLTQTLKLLKEVSPIVYGWFIAKMNDGTLIISEEEDKYSLAIYYRPTDSVTLKPLFFQQIDGVKCAVIVHEYKHSKQGIIKYCRHSISGNNSMTEVPAYYAESQVLNIFWMNDLVYERFLNK